MEAATIQYAADTHPGLKRHHNEDCYAADPELGLYLVADGVGGHACGEVAARIVRDTMTEQVRRGTALPEAVAASHAAVLEAIGEQAGATNMGSTVVALLLADEAYELCWVGDSRAYLFDGTLQRLTADHTRPGELLARGLITPEQAARHSERHVLTQSLGVSATMVLAPGYVKGTLQRGQRVLLCSDGLTDEIPDNLIVHLMGNHTTPREQVDALIGAALEAGGSDNITAIVIGDGAAATAIDGG